MLPGYNCECGVGGLVQAIILISGMPGTGKTSFAAYLSKQLRFPMISKDKIKEHLYDTLGFQNREEKVALGVAAMEVMYHFAGATLEVGQSVILENNFENVSKPGLQKLIDKYACKTVTVQFYAETSELYERFLEREKSPERHRGHVVNTRYPEVGDTPPPAAQNMDAAQFQAAMAQRGMIDFSIGGDRLLVDTTDFSKVSYENITEEIRKLL